MKLIFFGSDDFAAVSFTALSDSSHEMVACVTQPDRARGRGMKVTESPLKSLAIERAIPVLQPENIRDDAFVDELKKYDADLFVVVAYGQILSQALLDVPKIYCINVHGSLLPAYRGAAPINWAIINGDAQTGVTVQKMALKMDSGDVISQAIIDITDQDAVTLRTQLAERGASLLVETIDRIAVDEVTLTAQHDKDVTYAPKLDKNLGYIHWDKEAVYIARLIRGLKPWPGTFTFLTGLRLKILDAEAIECDTQGAMPGSIIDVRKNAFVVATGQGGLLVKEVHLESSRPANAGVFLSSYALPDGFRLG